MQTNTEIMPTLPADIFFLLDPDQCKAVQRAAGGDNAWIHGGDQKKRLQVITQLIINRIFEGGSMLICASQDTEQQLMRMLDSMGLDSMYFHLRQSISKPALASLQVSRKKGVKEDTQESTFLALEQYSRWHEKIAAQYSATNRKIFGDLTWQQLAEKTATGPDPEFKGLLAASMNASKLQLTLKEYWHLRGRIKTFQRLRVLRTSSFDHLDHLHDSLFNSENEQNLRASTTDNLALVVTRGRKLLAAIGTLVHRYRLDVSGQHHEELHALRCEIDRIRELLDQGLARYGNDFIAESTFIEFTGKIKQSISRKYQTMSQARKELVSKYKDLLGHLNGSMFKTEDQTQWMTETDLEHLGQNLELLITYLSGKATEIEQRATTHKKRMNAQNIASNHELQSDIRKIENEIDQFVNWINSCEIITDSIEVNALSLEKRSKVIQQTVLLCMRIGEAMVDFEAYYLWRNFWKQMPPHLRTLLKSLDVLDEQSQLDAFDAWYFENVLDQVPESHMVTSSLPVEERKGKLRDLRAIVLHHIKTQLQQKRHQTFRSIKGQAKALFNAMSSSRLNTVSDELHIIPAQALCKLFPIVFCTPGQLRDYAYYFDTLLVSDNNAGDYQAYQAQSRHCVLVTRALPGGIQSIYKELKTARLSIMSINGGFRWNDLPASDKLHLLNALASQFAPYMQTLKIYNARDIQIFSFLGDNTDSYILQRLGVPFKVVADQQGLEVKHITETLLDTSKPITLLTRDGIMNFGEGSDLFWQNSILKLVDGCGIRVLNNKGIDLKRHGAHAMNSLIQRVNGQRRNSTAKDEAAASA